MEKNLQFNTTPKITYDSPPIIDKISVKKFYQSITEAPIQNVTLSFEEQIAELKDYMSFLKFIKVFCPLMDILCIIIAVLSSITFIIILFSWIKIKKWRTLKNFIHINIICSYTLIYVNNALKVYYLIEFLHNNPVIDKLTEVLRNFGDTSLQCWVFVASIVTYMEIVKVFSDNVSRKKLKCCLFAWGIPLVSGVYYNTVFYFMSDIQQVMGNASIIFYVFFFLMIYVWILFDFLIYLRVVFSLFYVTIRVVDRREFIRKLQIATFIFLMSGSLMLPGVISVILLAFDTSRLIYKVKQVLRLVSDFQAIVLNVCILLLKPNRVLWLEYWRKRKAQDAILLRPLRG